MTTFDSFDPDAADFEVFAAQLRADTSDMPTFINLLAYKLEGALPTRVKVRRRSKGFLSKEKVVEKIEVACDGCQYVLLSDGVEVEARRAQVVRGIVLKNELLNVDGWITTLARDLAAEAQASEASRIALERLLS